MDGEAELAVDLQQPLQQQAVARVQGGIVVASEQAIGRQTHRRAHLFRTEPVRHTRQPILRPRERRDDIREHRRRTPRTQPMRRTQHAQRRPLSVGCGQVARRQLPQQPSERPRKERGRRGQTPHRRVRRPHVRQMPRMVPRDLQLGRARKGRFGRGGIVRQVAPGDPHRQRPKRRRVVLVAERRHHLLVEDLFAVARADEPRHQPPRLAVEAPPPRRLQHGHQPIGIAGEERLARTRRGWQARIGIGCEVDLVRRKVRPRPQMVPQADRDAAGRHRRDAAAIPHDVHDDMGIGRIADMPVPYPVRRVQMHLHVAAQKLPAHFDHGPAEIGSALKVPHARFANANRRASDGAQPIGPQRAVVPQRLDMPLRYGRTGEDRRII